MIKDLLCVAACRETPVVLCGLAREWPACTDGQHSWASLDYLRSVAGQRTVPVELGAHYMADGWSQQLMLFGEFLDRFIVKVAEDGIVGYVAQTQLLQQIPALKRDILVPDYCSVGGSPDVVIHAWFGPGGTVSPLHTDPKHNLLTQVVGYKYVRLYSRHNDAFVYPCAGKMSNTSQVDVTNPDLTAFPLFAKATYTDCILQPGDSLYIPPKCWHYVRSLSVSFSVSFWW